MGAAVDSRTTQFRRFLSDVYFLKNLNEDQLTSLAELCAEESFVAGQVIFSEGNAADCCYIVIDGVVDAWKGYAGSAPSLLGSHDAGHLFGEMALIDELPRSATLIARCPTRALAIPRDGFQRLVHQDVSIAVSVLTSISLMVRRANETFFLDLQERNEKLEKAYAELEQTQKEMLRVERLYTVGKFSSLILHDIRNPLSAMKSLITLMAMRLDDQQAVEYDLSRMRTEISRIERLASELLDYSRGEIRLTLTQSSSAKLMARFREEMEHRLSEASISLSVEGMDDAPIYLDEERILRLLINLSDNALKAMPSGGTLCIRARREDRWIIFDVADTGDGMDEDTLSHIFEPFFSRSPRGGTGLGMLIVKNIVEAHGGHIEIRSVKGEGTTVSVRLSVKA